ncbi:MAG: hypothetical protein CM1200mP30_03540 [Pseudomonadota bacterium]|nr:MAG: hypothetical protein CM1200mP30_03540 [Pseudomonadota bacterium]
MKISESQIETLIKLGHKRVEQFRANQLRAPNVGQDSEQLGLP